MSDEEKELILAQDKAQDKAQDEIVNEKISNMNEEEKETFKFLKKVYHLGFNGRLLNNVDIKNIVNIIEEQQKEIEELKMQLEVEKIDNKYNQEETHEETIPKYKIREKIEEITKEYYKLFEEKRSLDFMNINGHRYNAMKLVLEELLGE